MLDIEIVFISVNIATALRPWVTNTRTNPITLTTITTAICDPNGRLANVNENSAVIYKVTKQDNTGKFDIVNQILQQEQKSKKQK